MKCLSGSDIVVAALNHFKQKPHRIMQFRVDMHLGPFYLFFLLEEASIIFLCEFNHMNNSYVVY